MTDTRLMCPLRDLLAGTRGRCMGTARFAWPETMSQCPLSGAGAKSSAGHRASAMRHVESLGILCRVSAYFLVSQLTDPDREVPTKSEHSACGPRDADVTVTRGLRSVTTCPDACDPRADSGLQERGGCFGGQAGAGGILCRQREQRLPGQERLDFWAGGRCGASPCDTDAAEMLGIDDDIPRGTDRLRSTPLTAATIELGASGC
jgi:hypothetical protein